MDEWREWTAMIYHAISVANGAAYILEYEFEKYREEEERLKALEEFQREKYDEAYNALVQKIYSGKPYPDRATILAFFIRYYYL